MVTSCIVPQCRVWYGKLKDEFNVKFHNFPTDKRLKKLWQIKLKLNKNPSKSSKVCSMHFVDSDYRCSDTGN